MTNQPFFSNVIQQSNNTRSISMYDVKFGDCFIINDGSDQLLVDFGSKNAVNGRRPNNYSAVQSVLLTNPNTQCMVTHFHNDHYNGILALAKYNCQKYFSKVYIPNIYSAKNNLSLTLMELVLLSKNNLKWQYAYYALFSLIQLPKLMQNDKLYLLLEGDTFYLGKTTYNVLAPLKQNLIFDNDTYELFDNKINEKIETIIELIHNRIRYEENLCYIDIKNFPNEEYERLLTELISYGENLKKDTQFNKVNKKRLNRFKQLCKHENEHSIVFCSDDKCLLMTSDMTPNTWQHIQSQATQETTYKIIKIPHHGTCSHFVGNFPSPQSLLISNGKYNNWHICACYYTTYPKSIFYCTNNNGCIIYNAMKNCRTGNRCPCSSIQLSF